MPVSCMGTDLQYLLTREERSEPKSGLGLQTLYTNKGTRANQEAQSGPDSLKDEFPGFYGRL